LLATAVALTGLVSAVVTATPAAAAGPLVIANNAGSFGITTYDFSNGSTVNSFVPTGASGSNNGRGVAVAGNEVFYTEIGSDTIHVAPFNGGAGGADTRTLPNPRPGVGMQDLAFAGGALYALTGYGTSGPLEVFRLNSTTGAVIGGPVTIVGNAADADGFTVLPSGNFLINAGDASCSYAQFNPTTGAATGTSFVVAGHSECTGVDTDGTSLYFSTDFGTLTKTTLAGAVISNTSVGGNSAEDITLVQPASSLTTSIVGTPDPVTAGSNVQYTVTVKNNGTTAVSGVQVTDKLPTGTTFVSRSTNCTGTGPVTCSLGTINGGASKSVMIVVRTAPGSGGTTVTDSATTTPNGGTATFKTHISSTTTGTITPSGGSLTTGGNNPATLLLPPGGPGATVTLTLSTGATFCDGPCSDPQTTINNFPGYTDPNNPIVLRLTISHPTLATAQADLSSTVYKLIDQGPNAGTVITVPNCTTTNVATPHPCVNRRFVTQRPPNWQTTFEILYLSGDGTYTRH